MTDKSILTKILIVEDHPIVAFVTRNMISGLGYWTNVVVNGKEALTEFYNNYSLIFMDIDLPDMTGIEVAAEIRRREHNQKNIPIIAYTAYTDSNLKSSCLAVGIEEIINKPATPRKFQKTILHYCSK